MPTRDRREFVGRALQYFLRQDYPNKELVVLDDGSDPVGDLMPGDPRVRYIRTGEPHVLGAKRNLACEEARGPIIAHWDDDDWMGAGRLTYQVEQLLREEAQVCGLDRLHYFDPVSRRAWQYVYDPTLGPPWVAGGTLCYTRACWLTHPFPALGCEEDNQFVWSIPPDQLLVLPDSSFYVGLIHPGNASPKETSHLHNWRPQSLDTVRELIGEDWALYEEATHGR